MNEYEKELKRKIIQDFIKENKYSPSSSQIKTLEEEKLKRYTNLNRYGFSGFDLQKVKFKESVSCELENSNRVSIQRDLKVNQKKVEKLNKQIENNFLFANKNLSRMSKFLDTLEQQLNRLVLLNSKADLFLYGTEETFENTKKIDLENTTAHIERGYMTLSKESLRVVSQKDYDIKSSVSSTGSILGNVELERASTLKKADGSFYKNVVEAKSFDDIVQLNLFFNFKKSTYVGEIKVIGDSIESNSKSYYTVSYSTAEESYKEIAPANKRFSSGENYNAIGREVKSIKISIFKEKADFIDNLNKRFLYNFCLDSVEFTQNVFKKNQESIMYAGPYEFYNEEGGMVNFSMATLSQNTCCITPNKTSVSFFLSKDNENWFGVDYKKEKESVVKFESITDNSMLELIEEEKNIFDFIYDDTLTEESLEEALFNFRVTSEEYKKINIKNTILERNIKSKRKVYDASGGWFFDEKKSNYNCWIYVDSIAGRVIDFGPNSCVIDGNTKSGTVNLEQGYHTFSTSSSNWKEVERGLTNAKRLQEKDDLFPYNHKYLIEGYEYIKDFSGDKVYTGVEKVVGSLLKYVPPEIFYMEKNKDNLQIFTCQEIDGFYYFKVKILNSNSSWNIEQNNVIIQKQTSNSNQMYVKAILKSNDEGISPHVNSFSIRVI